MCWIEWFGLAWIYYEAQVMKIIWMLFSVSITLNPLVHLMWITTTTTWITGLWCTQLKVVGTYCYGFTAPLLFCWLSSFTSYARGCYALNGRTTWLWLAYSYIFLYVTCSRLVYLYVPGPVSRAFLTLLFWTVNSSMLTISPYAYSFCLVDSSAESLFLELWLVHLFTTRLFFYNYLYLYLAVSYIYSWRWGFVPHLQSTLQPP